MLERWAAWFFLAATLTMGSVPAGGLVLCLEPSGALVLESSRTGSACDGCEEPLAGASEPSARLAVEGGCPCVDIPVSDLAGVDRVPARYIDFCFDAPAAPAPLQVGLLPTRLPALRVRADVGPPRPPDCLPLIRSVVLHV